MDREPKPVVETCSTCGEERARSGGPRNPMFRIGKTGFTPKSAGDLREPKCEECRTWKKHALLMAEADTVIAKSRVEAVIG